MWALEDPAVIIIINLVESESVHYTAYSVPHMYDVDIGTNEGGIYKALHIRTSTNILVIFD